MSTARGPELMAPSFLQGKKNNVFLNQMGGKKDKNKNSPLWFSLEISLQKR